MGKRHSHKSSFPRIGVYDPRQAEMSSQSCDCIQTCIQPRNAYYADTGGQQVEAVS